MIPVKLMIKPTIVNALTFSSFSKAKIIITSVGHKLKMILISIDFVGELAKVIEKAKHNSKVTNSALEMSKNFLELLLKSGNP